LVSRDQPAHFTFAGESRHAWLRQCFPRGVIVAQRIGQQGNLRLVGNGGVARQAGQRELGFRRRQFLIRHRHLQKLGFIRHADRRQRTTRTLRRMIQRRRDRAGGTGAGGGDAAPDPILAVRIEDETHALASLAIEHHAFVARVTVFPQQQDLQTELHAIGVPEFAAGVAFAGRAGFVFDRTHRAGGRDGCAGERFLQRDLDQVELGDDAKQLRSQHDGAGVDDFVIFNFR
jgi:hypothetical protein